jgi:hypothetical protein
MQDGMAISNAMLQSRQQPMLYCSPQAIGLTGQQLAAMLTQQAEKLPVLRDTDYGITLLVTLMADFPCPSK